MSLTLNPSEYYIKQNKKPENRVELRLAVNAGSLCETDEEQGLAHFSEHMCFNGTKNFEKNELVNVLEKMGMKFGGDINATANPSDSCIGIMIAKSQSISDGPYIYIDNIAIMIY